jgi:hypothetical protein
LRLRVPDALAPFGLELLEHSGQRHHTGSELVDLIGESVLCHLEFQRIISRSLLGIGKSLLLLLNSRDCQQMIISRTLLGIAENLVRTHDPAEFRSGILVFPINIGMGTLDRATECSPQVIGTIVRKCAEQIVKCLHPKALAVVGLPCRQFELSTANSPEE